MKKGIFSKKSFFYVTFIYMQFRFFRRSPSWLHKKIFFSYLFKKSEKFFFFYVEDFLDGFIKKYTNKKVFAFLTKAKKENFPIMILSNSPDFLVKKIARRFSVKKAYGTTYKKDVEGRLIGIEKMVTGLEKKNIVKGKKVIFFTDSIWDMPLIKEAEKVFLVNPSYRLRFLAKKNGWRVL